MAVSFVSYSAAEANTLSMPSHQRGDLILAMGYRPASVGAITVPSGWYRLISRSGATGRTFEIAFKFALSNSETFGTWTSADLLQVAVYRGDGWIFPARVLVSNNAATSSVVNYPNIGTFSNSSFVINDSVLAGFVGINANDSVGVGAPTGMVNRGQMLGASAGAIGLHDTNATVTTWANQNVTPSVSVAYQTFLVELLESPISFSSGIPIGRLISGGV